MCPAKIHDKRGDYDFDEVNFSFLDRDVPRRTSYSVYILQLIRLTRVCSHKDYFNARNGCLTAKLLVIYLIIEFHFSVVHGGMNRNKSRAK